MTPADWERGDRHALAILFEARRAAPRWLVLVNAEAQPVDFTLPPGRLAAPAGERPRRTTARRRCRSTAPQAVPPGSLWVAKT